MLALSHELQYPIDEKCDILLLVLQQPKMFWTAKEKKNCQVYSYNNHQYWRIKLQETVCSHKFKSSF